MARRKQQTLSPDEWSRLPDEQLLQLRVRDLGLRIEGSWLEPRVRQFHAELDERGIAFHPSYYLADEWLCPDREPIIGIAFYLAHPRLKRLEQKMMLEVEGGTEKWCMKLLRHEGGHAINYAYLLFKRTRWRELFGPVSARYTNSYSARPYSRRYVTHLNDNYAQAHPEEDFAETFAVWLTPGNNWRERYRDWPALKKLLYVDHLMKEIGATPPRVTGRDTPWSAARMTSTLAAYYQRRRRYLGEEFPGFYDPGLRRLFAAGAEHATEPAGPFLRRWRRQIVNSVAMWTGERKFDIDRLLRKLIRRSEAMGLRLQMGEAETLSETSAFVTAAMEKVHGFLAGTEDQ